MVEATLVLLVFFALLLGVIDCGQVLFAHQSLVERVRTAVRWGVVHPWDRTAIRSSTWCSTTRPKRPAATAGFLGIAARERAWFAISRAARRPDDETLSVAIVNFQPQFFSPWIARAVVSPRPV